MRRVAVQGGIIQGSFFRTKVHGHLTRKEFHEGKLSGVSYIRGGGIIQGKMSKGGKSPGGNFMDGE